MYQLLQASAGGLPANANTVAGVKRAREHQRTPSGSTIASNDPSSPYMQSTAFPHIANPEQSPQAAAFQADALTVGKTMATAGQLGGELSPNQQQSALSAANMALKEVGLDAQTLLPNDADDQAPSRQSTSSYGNDSPATPQSEADVDARIHNYRNPIQLHRTESQVYQDELYSPNLVYTSAPSSKLKSNLLSPHSNLISERLQTANLARASSPATALSRDRSPFQTSSTHNLAQEWKPNPSHMGTAANMRQQQKEEATRAELARQQPKLRREPTKTMSPQDAVLDYTADGEVPLFQDNIPLGYKQHLGGTEQWAGNVFSAQPANFMQAIPGVAQPSLAFSGAATVEQPLLPAFDFNLMQQNNALQNPQFPLAFPMAKPDLTDATPDFPVTLPSMESSISDLGPGPSSQESASVVTAASTPQRPDDTRANTGTYTCTYHGCTQRFDTPATLQKHKREFHQSPQQRDTASASAAGSTSPESSTSPAPSGSGMTSAALQARNSQAGPHKCTRINPSTGKPCNTIFSRPYDLTRHEDTIHNNRKHKVQCPLCREEKSFSRNDALTRHMRVVHPEVESYGKRGRH